MTTPAEPTDPPLTDREREVVFIVRGALERAETAHEVWMFVCLCGLFGVDAKEILRNRFF